MSDKIYLKERELLIKTINNLISSKQISNETTFSVCFSILAEAYARLSRDIYKKNMQLFKLEIKKFRKKQSNQKKSNG